MEMGMMVRTDRERLAEKMPRDTSNNEMHRWKLDIQNARSNGPR